MREHRSLTSDLVAAVRAFYSALPAELDTVHDTVAETLLPRGMALPARLIRRSPALAPLVHDIVGAVSLGLAYVVPLRTHAIDAVLFAELERGTRQLVLLGAGLDTRAWRLSELRDTTVFEVDHPETQRYKRAMIAGRTPSCKSVEFCAIDFEQQRLQDVLDRADFKRDEPAFFIWEGVTMYLTRPALGSTIASLGELTAQGSVVAATYVPTDVMRRATSALGQRLFDVVGEPVIGAIASEELGDVFAEHGFRAELDEGTHDWAERTWPSARRRFVRDFERLRVSRRLGSRELA